MNPRFFPDRLLAADDFEALIENSILRTDDLYDLDGETFLRRRGGSFETCDVNDAEFGGALCR